MVVEVEQCDCRRQLRLVPLLAADWVSVDEPLLDFCTFSCFLERAAAGRNHQLQTPNEFQLAAILSELQRGPLKK